MKTLIVFHRGKLVGSILDKASTGISFQYSDDADFRLSVSLPLSNKIYTAKEIEPFFSGLLPDGELREQIAKDAHVSSSSWFKLLSNYGREIAGAIEIIEDDEESSDPTKYSYTKLQKEEISTRISNANAIPLLTWGGKTRMSLAGAQNKIALFEKEGELYMPNGGAPTNVILKAGVNSYSINEYTTTHIASYLGINTPETLIKDYDGTLAFITRRFDRKEVDEEVIRLHQEDMCQALSVVPENKYEEDGGPSFIKIKDLLIRVTETPIIYCKEFAKIVIFNYLFGNCDANGKNYALLYPDSSTNPYLAPFYDLLCTTIYDWLSRKMAMKIGREKEINRITKNDIIECGIVGKKEMMNILDFFISNIPFAFCRAKNELEEIAQPMIDAIERDVMERIRKL